MRKNYILTSLVLLVFSFGISTINAQISGMPSGYITTTPIISTEEAPVWYNMMASNSSPRENRYIYWDETNFKTDRYDEPGITNEIQNDKYLFRLQQGPSGPGYVIVINKTSGKQLYAESSIVTDGKITLAENGIEWKMGASTDLSTALPGQYYFNYEGWTDYRFLNASDGVRFNWEVLVFNGLGSLVRSSGWFFYPVTTMQSVTYNQSANGTISVTGTNGTSTPANITSGSNILVGTVLNISVTPAQGFKLESLTVNNADVTAQVADSKYQFAVNTDPTISASFVADQSTGIGNIKLNAELFPNPFNDELKINSNDKNIDKVEIFNIQGVKVYNSTQITNTINTSNFVPGYYFIKIYSGNETQIQKIVKLN